MSLASDGMSGNNTETSDVSFHVVSHFPGA